MTETFAELDMGRWHENPRLDADCDCLGVIVTGLFMSHQLRQKQGHIHMDRERERERDRTHPRERAVFQRSSNEVLPVFGVILHAWHAPSRIISEWP